MSAEPLFDLALSAGRFLVSRLGGTERAHAPFRLSVTGWFDAEPGQRAEVDVEALLGSPARLTIRGEHGGRTIAAIIDGVDAFESGYRLHLVPRLARLSLAVDHRLFRHQDTLAIVREVLGGHEVPVESRIARPLTARPQCVQAFESDLSFVSRLLAEEGIAYHVEHGDAGDVVVLGDNPGAYAPIGGGDELPFGAGEAGGLVQGESVFEARLNATTVTERVTLSDFDPEKPLVDQRAAAGDGLLERYEYPGGYRDPAQGSALAAIRREEAESARRVLRGRTTSRRLAPGATFRLVGAPRDDINGQWLVLELAHEGQDHGAGAAPGASSRYVAAFVAVPADRPYRPARSPQPTMGGVQSATITGPRGSEIHTEAAGRVTALLRWDRRRTDDDTSSHWLRPVQPATSGGVYLPRVGWETLLGFSGLSADVPYELGRLYNGRATPPEGLPGQKVRGAFGSETTPGGGSANLLRIDDAAGAEGMLINASHDYNERTENDKKTTVAANDAHTIGSDHKDLVGIVQEVKIDGAQSYSIGADRDLSVGGNLVIEAASESIGVGGLRSFTIGGDFKTAVGGALTRTILGAKAEIATLSQNVHVTGGSRVSIGGTRVESAEVAVGIGVLGASNLSVAGAYTIASAKYSLSASTLKEDYASMTIGAGGVIEDAFAGAASLSVGGSLTLTGSVVSFVAMEKISIDAAGVTVTITPGSIEIAAVVDSAEDLVVTGMDVNE
ncbi:MAG: type VI secretion system tip protein TssI/VgrG [Byssovorax sp.]